jgi:diguanylate cyclase (GGDEF)-like protein
LVPILVVGTVVTTIAVKTIKNIKIDDTKNILQGSAKELAYSYEGYSNEQIGITEVDGEYYLGETKISDDYSVIDRMKGYSGNELSVFYQDTRILTTILSTDGERYIHTKASEVWLQVMNGDDYFSNDIVINGEHYFGYYAPIHDSYGKVIGMSFAGVPGAELSALVKRTYRICIFICVILCAASVVLCSIASGYFMSIQKGIISYLREIDEGQYEHTMDIKLTKRKDEYGVMSRLFVKMNNSLVSLILKDGLTELYNRRAAMKKLEGFMMAANSVGGEPFTFAICDIDFFKKVNDTYGHNCGDIVLKMVSEKLRAAEVDQDFVARWGGEEFIIVLKGRLDKNLVTINAIADSIRSSVVTYDGKEVRVTMTFGVTEYHAPENLDNMISRADSLLYQGKEGGRNRVVS